jgi:predicted CoA-binding protein
MADLVERQLKESKTIAVVGLSPNPDRDSNRVALYLQKVGYRVIPINPMVEEVLGEKSYPDLKSIPADIEIDMVDVFRRSELVEPVVDEAIELGVKFIWMQDGVIHDESAKKAEAAGIPVIMDN